MGEDDRERWNARHASFGGTPVGEAAPFLEECLSLLEARGLPAVTTALDVACGRGRNALLLARGGFRVAAVDISDVAIDSLAARAAVESLDLRCMRRDLTSEGIPPGQFGLVVVVSYLERGLLPALRAAVAPGGALVMETFLDAPGREDVVRAGWRLRPGEIASMAGDLETLTCRESPETGRACLLAIRPMRSASLDRD